ncbi:MAG: acyl carrier protein [Peptostreptococcaceae bacterium]|nr:acyl carrier protein [Peptostreptococcaceae bacterium]
MLEKMKELIVEGLGVDAEQIKLESKFYDDLGADSLDLVELVMSFEDEFGVEIPTEDLEKIRTVGDAIKYIESKKEA